MKFNIGKSIHSENPKNAYRVKIEFMHGDADAYTDENLPEFPADTMENKFGKLEDCVNMLMRIEKLGYVNRDQTLEMFATIPHFEAFFGAGYDCEWPSDQTYYDYPAAYEGFKVSYFDENGLEYKVTITE